MNVPIVRCYGSSASSTSVNHLEDTGGGSQQRVSRPKEVDTEAFQVIKVVRNEGWKFVEKVNLCPDMRL